MLCASEEMRKEEKLRPEGAKRREEKKKTNVSAGPFFHGMNNASATGGQCCWR